MQRSLAAYLFWGEKRMKSRKRPSKKAQDKFIGELLGIGFIGVAVYLCWVIIQTPVGDNPALRESLGFIGAFIYRTVASLAGTGKLLCPIFLILLGVNMFSSKINLTKVQLISSGVAFICVLVLLHLKLAFGENSIALGWSGVGGGVIGALFAFILGKAFGQIGAYIALAVIFIIAVMMATRGSLVSLLQQFFQKIIAGLKRIKEAISHFVFMEVSAEGSEAAKEAKPKRRLKKEVAAPVAEKPIIINNLHEIQQDIAQKKSGKMTSAEVEKAIPKEKIVKEIKNEAEIAEPFKVNAEDETPYIYPTIDLLGDKIVSGPGITQEEINEKVGLLQKTLSDFGVKGQISEVSCGPAITRYEFQPAPGVKVSKIVNLADDIALSLAAAGIRIEAPIPGKAAVGIEVPNKEISTVVLKEVLESAAFQNSKSKLTVALGKDISGQAIIADLSKMPHLLIAGSTGSGKSVCMNTLITSILFKATPNEVKFLMVDPKMVELGNYNGIPHLISPVVTDPKKAASALRWAVQEMERRYELFANNGAKDMGRFNQLSAERLAKCSTEEEKAKIEVLPYIVVLIDELADLMMVAPADVEDAICRLAQMARAAGIHLVVATQRPSVDVITGIIKANIPSRIAFAVSSQIDSRTILDMGGAEKLLGKGDMLFYPTGLPKPLRVQGVFASDQDIDNIVQAIKVQGEPEYDESIGTATLREESKQEAPEDDDPLIGEAAKLFIENGQASISVLQRRFRIGYNRAARIIDQMEQKGLIGAYEGSKPRQVKVTMDDYCKMYE